MNTFAQGWLDIQCQTIEGVYNAVLLLNDADKGSFRPVAYGPVGAEESNELIPIAQVALQQRQKAVNTSVPGAEPEESAFDYLALPIVLEDLLIGVIAVKMAHRPEEKQKEVSDLLETGSKWLALTRCKQDSPPTDFYMSVVRLVASCLDHDTFKAASTALTTQMSTLLGCERVTFGILKGRHTEVTALSNSARFDPRSNLIRAIAEVMDEAIEQDSIIVYPPADESESVVSRAHAELARKFGSGSVCSIPLTHDTSIIGSLVLEAKQEGYFNAEVVRLCEQSMALVAPFLELKRQEEKWLIHKAWDSLRSQASELFGLKHLGLKLAGMVLALFIAFASVTDGDFKVGADAVLEGKIQREIAAAIDGYIATADFRAGDTVNKGDVLARLDDKDLNLEHLKLSSERQKLMREYRQAMATGDRVQVRVLSAQIEQTKAEIDLIEQQLARTQITAPFDGIIIDGDLSQSLGAPVERGDSLFKIAPLEGYRIVLEVDERLIAYVTEGQQGRLALSSMPGKRLPFVVEKVTTVANAEEGRNVFRVEAALQELPELLRPGMQGQAKINGGQAKLIWIWTHELIDWLRLGLWSWWP